MQPVSRHHEAGVDRPPLGGHARYPASSVTQGAGDARAFQEGHARFDAEGRRQDGVEAQPSHPESPARTAPWRRWKRCRGAERPSDHPVGDRMQPGRTVRDHGVEEAEAPQHGDAARHQALAAGLVEDDDPVAGTGQQQGGRDPAGSGSDHHHVGVLGAHQPILHHDGDVEPHPAVDASAAGWWGMASARLPA